MPQDMREDAANEQLPKIILGAHDRARLTGLAMAALDRQPDTAEELLSEIERATIVEPDAVPPDVVRMGSVVEYRTDQGDKRVTVVFPAEADIAAGKVSVLTPIGTALIGLSKGQSISWTARDGRSHRLTILSVEPPAEDDESH
jgi:regulator of nucleoside diphosphate kinase